VVVLCVVRVWCHFLSLRFITARDDNPALAAEFALDLVVALGYSAALLCAKNLRRPQRFRTFHRGFASFSYTVYLVHFPAMVFVAAMMKDVFNIGFPRPASVGALVYAAAFLMAIYGYAWIFAALTEAHTDAIRSRLSLVVSALRYRANSIRSVKHRVLQERARRRDALNEPTLVDDLRSARHRGDGS
jgi:peptidoglycan/LPS O-acetylase OafA/YrhL